MIPRRKAAALQLSPNFDPAAAAAVRRPLTAKSAKPAKQRPENHNRDSLTGHGTPPAGVPIFFNSIFQDQPLNCRHYIVRYMQLDMSEHVFCDFLLRRGILRMVAGLRRR